MVPVFAVYSTFLQRAYDELIHDVSLQGSKVILAIDRAGVVGEDGVTHQGLYDVAFLRTIPDATVYSPAGFDELRLQLNYCVTQGTGLCAIRYPRGVELFLPPDFTPTCAPCSLFGDETAAIALITYGRIFSFAAQAVERLRDKGISVVLLKLNRIIPLDFEDVRPVLHCREIFFFEEGVRRGGVGEEFGFLLENKQFSGSYHLQAVEDPRVPHAPMFRTLDRLGLSAEAIESMVLERVTACQKGDSV